MYNWGRTFAGGGKEEWRPVTAVLAEVSGEPSRKDKGDCSSSKAGAGPALVSPFSSRVQEVA